MSIKSLPFAILLLAGLACPALAHDFWAGNQGPASDGKLEVFIGFGHNFPTGEEITAENMAARYGPIMLYSSSGQVPLAAAPDEPRAMVTAEALAKGTYLAAVTTKVGFSGRSPDGWVNKAKKEDPTVTNCAYGGNFGKAVVNIGGASDEAAAAKEIGHVLEIVPLANPATVKVGQPLPVKVLFKGQPLPRAAVNAYFAGFTEKNTAFAFSSNTNREGTVDIIPLRAGDWLATVDVTEPYSDLSVCDRERYEASLAFKILD